MKNDDFILIKGTIIKFCFLIFRETQNALCRFSAQGVLLFA
jgi:hypothetical protein